MKQNLQTMQKRVVHPVGRQRLRFLLMGLGGTPCALAMALVLVLYGTPYNPIWWWVMGAILLAACAVSGLLAPVVEWALVGYLQDRAERCAGAPDPPPSGS